MVRQTVETTQEAVSQFNWETVSENQSNLARILFPFSKSDVSVALDYVSYLKSGQDNTERIAKLERIVAVKLDLGENADQWQNELTALNSQVVHFPPWLTRAENGSLVVKVEETKAASAAVITPFTRDTVLTEFSLLDTGQVPSHVKLYDYNGTFIVIAHKLITDSRGISRETEQNVWRLNRDNTTTSIPVEEFMIKDKRKAYGVIGNRGRQVDKAGKPIPESAWYVNLDAESLSKDTRFYPTKVETSAVETSAVDQSLA